MEKDCLKCDHEALLEAAVASLYQGSATCGCFRVITSSSTEAPKCAYFVGATCPSNGYLLSVRLDLTMSTSSLKNGGTFGLLSQKEVPANAIAVTAQQSSHKNWTTHYWRNVVNNLRMAGEVASVERTEIFFPLLTNIQARTEHLAKMAIMSLWPHWEQVGAKGDSRAMDVDQLVGNTMGSTSRANLTVKANRMNLHCERFEA